MNLFNEYIMNVFYINFKFVYKMQFKKEYKKSTHFRNRVFLDAHKFIIAKLFEIFARTNDIYDIFAE